MLVSLSCLYHIIVSTDQSRDPFDAFDPVFTWVLYAFDGLLLPMKTLLVGLEDAQSVAGLGHSSRTALFVESTHDGTRCYSINSKKSELPISFNVRIQIADKPTLRFR